MTPAPRLNHIAADSGRTAARRSLEETLEIRVDPADTLSRLEEPRLPLRAEWYIIILILVELLPTLCEIFLQGCRDAAATLIRRGTSTALGVTPRP